jgi:hypothetical protein
MLQIIFLQVPVNETWDSGLDALKGALKLEADVTRKIHDIITECENGGKTGGKTGGKSGSKTGFNDYHVCFII